MNLYKDKDGNIFGYSDEDLDNLKQQGIDPIKSNNLTPFSYTSKELAAQKLEQDKQLLMGQAQQLLNNSDYRVTVDKMESYTPEKQTAVKEYREALREVIRQAKEGVLTELPTPNF
jgi:hypothetical protein